MNSRSKGVSFEQKVAARLREIWPGCYTCRYAGNLWLDHCGVDLVGTGKYRFQCKAVEKLSPSYHEILAAMPDGDGINVIVHKRNNRGVVVALPFEDFINLIKRDEEENKKARE